MGYGIDTDISFEDEFSRIYQKPSFGFDCGIEGIKTNSELTTFVRQCIANDQYLYDPKNTDGNISTFSEQIKQLGLNNKKVFIKMDIEGAEYEAFEDIYSHHQNITGIALEIHFNKKYQFAKAVNLLKYLQRDFYLVHVHGNNGCKKFNAKNMKGSLTTVVELTLINKSLVSMAKLSENQAHPTPLDMPNTKGVEDVKFEVLSRFQPPEEFVDLTGKVWYK